MCLCMYVHIYMQHIVCTHIYLTHCFYIYLYMKVTTVNKKKQELMKFKLYIHFILLSFWMADDASDLSTVSRNQNSQVFFFAIPHLINHKKNKNMKNCLCRCAHCNNRPVDFMPQPDYCLGQAQLCNSICCQMPLITM